MRRINERREWYTYSACAWSVLRPLLKRFDHSGIRRATRVSNWNDRFSISVLRLKYRWYVMKLLLFCRLMWEGMVGGVVMVWGDHSYYPSSFVFVLDIKSYYIKIISQLRFWLDKTFTIFVAFYSKNLRFSAQVMFCYINPP